MFWGCKLSNTNPISIKGDDNAILSITNISLVDKKKKFDKRERVCLCLKQENSHNYITIKKFAPAFQQNLNIHLITKLSPIFRTDLFITGSNCQLHLIGNVQRQIHVNKIIKQ